MNGKGDWRKILGVPETTITGDIPDCNNCGVECDNKRRPHWICGSWKEADNYQLEIKLDPEEEDHEQR